MASGSTATRDLISFKPNAPTRHSGCERYLPSHGEGEGDAPSSPTKKKRFTRRHGVTRRSRRKKEKSSRHGATAATVGRVSFSPWRALRRGVRSEAHDGFTPVTRDSPLVTRDSKARAARYALRATRLGAGC